MSEVVRARPAPRVAPRLRHRGSRAPRRRLPAVASAHARRRDACGRCRCREDLPVRAAPPHAAPAARAHRRARLASRRRLPDPQPDPPRARAPDEGRARVRGRPRRAPARRARRRTTTCPPPCASRPTRRCIELVLPAPRARSSPRSPPRCATPGRARRSSTRSSARTTASRHLIVGRDHAGVGRYYGPYEAQQIFDRFEPRTSSASTPLRFDPTFFCHTCDALASPRTCPHDEGARLELSGTRVREILRSGGRLPREFTRPEIAEILRGHYAGGEPAAARASAGAAGARRVHRLVHGALGRRQEHARRGAARAARASEPAGRGPRRRRGARCTSRRASASARRTATRTSAASATWRGCSRATARPSITAAISPYRDVRDEVRRHAEEDGIPFVEVFASASDRRAGRRAT